MENEVKAAKKVVRIKKAGVVKTAEGLKVMSENPAILAMIPTVIAVYENKALAKAFIDGYEKAAATAAAV